MTITTLILRSLPIRRMKMSCYDHYHMMRLSIFLLIVLLIISCQFKKTDELPSQLDLQDSDHVKKEVVVFVYHRFGNNKYPSTNISLIDFEKHLNYLKTNKFEVMSFGDAVDYINTPEIPYKKKVACITVDDGYKTFFTNGLPLLKKYEFPATIFVNTESVGGGSYMDWNELKKINEAGIEIGNHSHSHPYFLNTKDKDRIDFFKSDVTKCQELIENHLGFKPEVFVYPYGEFDLEMKAALKEMGFKAAAAQNSGVMHAHDNFAIPRFPMAGPYVNINGFIEKANMRPLRVRHKNLKSFELTGKNPPALSIVFHADSVDLSKVNCFISAGCQSTFSNDTLTIKAENALRNRRSLYTITAPSKTKNEWYWFSHLWIRPEIAE